MPGPILLKLLQGVGAPLLERFITDRLGRTVASAVQPTIEIIADELGVAPTEDAIAAAHAARPDRVKTAVQKIEASPEKIAALAELTRAENEQALSFHRLLGAEGQADSPLIRYARPATVYATILAVLGIVATACLLSLRAGLYGLPDGFTLEALSPILVLVAPALTGLVGLAGYWMKKRTDEKITGATQRGT